MKSRFTVKLLSILSILVLVALCAGIAVWQHREVTNRDDQLRSAKSQTAVLKKQLSTLSDQLNKANQSINNLRQNNSFVSDATCQSQQLMLQAEKNEGGAAGSTGELFSYQNTSNTPCTVKGDPGFLALDSTGHVMPNGPVDTANAGLSQQPQLISLAPSAKAYFLAHWPAHDAVGQQKGCVTPSLIESTPPGSLLPLAMATSDVAPICGTPTVTALGTASDFGL